MMRKSTIYSVPARAYASITLSGSAQGLSTGASTRYEGATVQAEGGDVRYTLDGASTAQATVGFILADGETLSLMHPSCVDQASFINVAEVSVTLHIHYH